MAQMDLIFDPVEGCCVRKSTKRGKTQGLHDKLNVRQFPAIILAALTSGMGGPTNSRKQNQQHWH